MKTARMVMCIALLMTFSGGIPAMADPRPDARIGVLPGGCVRHDLDVYVWPDRGVDAVYYPDDPISVFFEVTQDCYVVVYDIDTRGRLHILFPFDPRQDNFIRAGQVYEIPRDWDDFGLTVEGPPGDEYIQAVASPYPLELPDWPIYVNSPGHYPNTCADPDLMDFRAGDDRIGYLHRVNRKIVRDRWDWCATDLARFYVHPRPVQRPFHIYPGGWYDPWPDDFYGAVYIGWPIGTRIYVDGVFVGIAPCWVRDVSFGEHWMRAYDGDRVVCEKQVRYRHKEWYRKDFPDYRIKGGDGREIYRTGVKGHPLQADNPRIGQPIREKPLRTRVGEIERSGKVRLEGREVRPPKERDRVGKVDRLDRPVDRPQALNQAGGNVERKPGKWARFVSAAGQIVGGAEKKERKDESPSVKPKLDRSDRKADRSDSAKPAVKADRGARASKRR